MKALEVGLHPKVCLSDVHHEAPVGAKALEVKVRVTLHQDATPMLAYSLNAVPLFLRCEHHHAPKFIHTDVHTGPCSRPLCPIRQPELL